MEITESELAKNAVSYMMTNSYLEDHKNRELLDRMIRKGCTANKFLITDPTKTGFAKIGHIRFDYDTLCVALDY